MRFADPNLLWGLLLIPFLLLLHCASFFKEPNNLSVTILARHQKSC